MLSREFFHQLEDEINRARYEIDEKHMGLAEVKARLAHIAGIENLKVEPTPRGDEVYTLGDIRAVVPIGNDRASMSYLAEKLSNPFQEPEKPTMSITGAANLAGTIKDRINTAKQRIAAVSANTDGALAKLNDAADTGDKIAKQIEAEADDLLAQIGQFSNGGPE